jgi:hypothetical protein
MRSSSILLLFFVCNALNNWFLYAQDNEAFTNESMAEKVYLQLDNDIYANDDTIWFKAILVNAATHKRDRTSSLLQVELVDARDQVKITKLIKVNNGIGRGQISLNEKFLPGIYMIRANTRWNENFSSNFGFKTYIHIYSEVGKEQFKLPVDHINQTSLSNGEKTLKLDLFPKAIDKFHDGKLTVIVDTGVATDTLLVKEKGSGSFPISLSLADSLKQIKVQFVTKTGTSYVHDIALDQDFTSLQFFPESGKMIHGFKSKVAYKALGLDGKGKMISGKVLNSDGQEIAGFQSDSLGMGHFIIPMVDSNQKYQAIVQIGEGRTIERLLPKAFASGTVMHVREVDSNIHLEIESSVYTSGVLLLEGICRGYKYFREALSISDGRNEIVIPKKKFPEGPIAFKLLTKEQLPVLERLFFNERLDRRLQIAVNGLEPVVTTREKQQFDISVKNNADDPTKANVSVLVFNKENRAGLNSSMDNLISYLLLRSELKGPIENPSVYFESKHYHLDDLMLTQGWRNFKYTSPVKHNSIPMETSLEVSGVVNPKKSKKTKEQGELLLMAFDKDRSIYSTEISIPGNFKVKLLDTFGDKVDMALQVKGQKKPDDYVLALNRRRTLAGDFNYKQLEMAKDERVQSNIENRITRKLEEQKILDLEGVTVLEEVVLNGYNMSPERKKISDIYGLPRVVIEEQEIVEKEQSWSYGLFSVLESFFRDKISIWTSPSGPVIVKSITEQGRSGAPTLIVVDGFPVTRFDYPLLRNMRTDQIKSVEVIDNADNFGNLYKRVFPDARPPIPERGSVVAIYSKAGTGIFGTFGNNDSDVVTNEIMVFAVEKEFYVPPYDQENTYAVKDFRSPVYWQPIIETNSDGNASIGYYHSDNQGDFTVVIEAISETGQIAYKALPYSVAAKN